RHCRVAPVDGAARGAEERGGPRMRTLLTLSLLLALVTAASAQQLTKVGRHITSATTTTLVAGSTGSSPLALFHGSLCVDAGGVQTGVTLQDSAGTNLVGTGVKWVIPAGACLVMVYKGSPYFNGTAVGRGLQVVTDA